MFCAILNVCTAKCKRIIMQKIGQEEQTKKSQISSSKSNNLYYSVTGHDYML